MAIIGIDEVGRGAWAGPLVVGAVLLSATIDGLKDSKLLTKQKREKLAALIHSKAAFVGLGWVSSSEVDDLGLSGAMKLACVRALKGAPTATEIIIDGTINYLPENELSSVLIDGDHLEPAISAASIVAKVARDAHMAELALLYPGYGFATNVGYGTKAHHRAMQELGLTPQHRWSFKPVKDLLNSYEA